MTNMQVVIAAGSFLLIWAVVAFVVALFIKLGQRVWRRFKEEFHSDKK